MSVDITIQETVNEVDITVNQNVITVNVTRTTGGGGGGVESVTGDLVNNTDPLNPIINTPTLAETLAEDNKTNDIPIVSNNGKAVVTVNDDYLDISYEGNYGSQALAMTDTVVQLYSEVPVVFYSTVSTDFTTPILRYNNEEVATQNWVTSQGYGTGTVTSVTGDLVDNTDPLNPVVETPNLTQVLTQGDISSWFEIFPSFPANSFITIELGRELTDNYYDTFYVGTGGLFLDKDIVFPENSTIKFQAGYVQDNPIPTGSTLYPYRFTTDAYVFYQGAIVTDITIQPEDVCILKYAGYNSTDSIQIWFLTIVSSGGSGTVTNVSGTTDEITVSNPTTTPVVGISSNYTTARDAYADAKVEDNLTASTTVAPSKTAVNTALENLEDSLQGVIFNDAFNATVDATYTAVGSPTYSFGASGITLSGGSGNFSKYLSKGYTSSLENNEIVCDITPSVNGTGFAIGYQGVSSFTSGSIYAYINLNAVTNRGQLIISSSTAGTLATSASNLTYTTSTDNIRLIFRRNKYSFEFIAVNLTNNTIARVVYAGGADVGAVALGTIWKPSFYAHGGTQIVKNFIYSSNVKKGAKILWLGDSITNGMFGGGASSIPYKY